MHYDAYFGIYPGSELDRISSTDITVPLGQLVLASAVRRKCPGTMVKVFYGELTDEEVICSEIQDLARHAHRSLVGITLNAGSTRSAFGMAQHLSACGLDVILGGPEVWSSFVAHGDLMLSDKQYIRGMVIGAGERVLPRIMSEGLGTPMPNVVLSNRGGRSGDVSSVQPHRLDFEGVDVDYSLLHGIERLSGVSYLWRSDCHLAHGQRCYFCGRIELGGGTRRPRKVWDELRQARDSFGMTHFYNTADSVGMDMRDLEAFADARPHDFGQEVHRCFMNAHQVNSRSIGYLQRLNAMVAIGIESYALFDAVGKKGSSPLINERAIAALDVAGLRMVLSFVLGLPGETSGTLEATGRYVMRLLSSYPMITSIEISPLMVTCGSGAYRDLMRDAAEEYRGCIPPFDSLKMSTGYFSRFCRVSRREALEWSAELIHQARRLRPDLLIDVKGITPDERGDLCQEPPLVGTRRHGSRETVGGRLAGGQRAISPG